MLADDRLQAHSQPKLCRITAELSGKRSLRNSTPKFYNLARSNDGLYIDRFTIILFIVANPLSELGQKTDSLCLLKLELLICAVADPFSGFLNVVESSCLPNCDRTQIIKGGLKRRYWYV
jgi:hypothetical protein